MGKIFSAIYSIGLTMIGIGLLGTGEEVAGSICLLGVTYSISKLWEEGN